MDFRLDAIHKNQENKDNDQYTQIAKLEAKLEEKDKEDHRQTLEIQKITSYKNEIFNPISNLNQKVIFESTLVSSLLLISDAVINIVSMNSCLLCNSTFININCIQLIISLEFHLIIIIYSV